MYIKECGYNQFQKPRLSDDSEYLRGLQEGIDVGLIKGIEKGLSKCAELTAQRMEKKGFSQDLIKEIVGEFLS